MISWTAASLAAFLCPLEFCFVLIIRGALKPWRKCQVVNHVIQINGAQAITMGNVDLTDSTGKVTRVDKTWSFIKEPDASVRIVLHHSSLPFSN